MDPSDDPSTSASSPRHTFSTTLRGGLKLWLDSYSYVKQKTSNGSGHIRFSCCQRQNLHCRGFLVTSEDMKEILRSGPHNHVPVDQEKSDQFHIDGWKELDEKQKLVLIEQVKMRPQLWTDIGKNLRNKRYWIDVAVMVLGSMELSAARICCNTFNVLRQTMPDFYCDLLAFLQSHPDAEENNNLSASLISPHEAMLGYISDTVSDVNSNSLDAVPSKRIKLEPTEDYSVFEASPVERGDSSPVQESSVSIEQAAGFFNYGMKVVEIATKLTSRGMNKELEGLKRKLEELTQEMEASIRHHDLPLNFLL